jgi:hypothetical protein
MKRPVLAVLSVLGLAYGWGQWVNAHRIVSSPDNQTALFQSYNPEPVISRFRPEGEGFEGFDGNSASQGIKSIQHHKEFTPRFPMQADRERELLNALREDIILRLRSNGMNVMATHDEADGGFAYKYLAGNSEGSITVKPLVHVPVQRSYPLPTGLEYVSVTIALEETWTRPASESQWWMAMAD